MAKYTSKPFMVGHSADVIAEKFSDLTRMQPMLDRLPEEQKQQLGNVTLNTDSVTISTQQLGDVTFQVVERTPERVKMEAQGMPIPLNLEVLLDPKSDEQTETTCQIDVDIPMMLRPLIGPQMQKAIDMLGEVIGNALA